MKSAIHVLVISIVCFTINLATSFSCFAEQQDSWVKYGETDNFIAYYDKYSIKKHGNFIEVWSKKYFINQGYRKNTFLEYKADVSKYERLIYTKSLYYIFCNNKIVFTKHFVSHGDDEKIRNNTINNYDDNDAWDSIFAEPVMEDLYNIICK